MMESSYDVALMREPMSASALPSLADPLSVEHAVDVLVAMAHPARLAVLSWLHRRGPASVGELAEGLSVEQSAMSHHLRLLRDRRLVATERDGRWVKYRLDDDQVGCIVEDAIRHASERVGGDVADD